MSVLHREGIYLYLDYGNTQLTNQIPSLEVTIFVSYLFRGNYFAALGHLSYAYWPWQPRLQFRACAGRQMERARSAQRPRLHSR